MMGHRRTTRVGLTFVLGMIAAAVLVPPAAARTETARTVGIRSISSGVADRGGTVSIVGNGFGGPNVRITVDGIAAELLAATGSTARFRVPALAGPGRVLVRATNPGGQIGEIGLHVRFDGVSTPVLDASGRVSATIGRAGGSLASRGVTLTVPAGALSEDTTIALTPLLDLAHSPLAGSMVGGVKLEPEGLLFLAPAALTMALPAGVAPSEVLGFGSAGDGSELHLQPHTVAGGTITLRIRHFSTAGAAAGGAAAAAVMQTHQPTNAERNALQRIAAARQACEAEVSAGVFAGPACADVRPEGVRALFDWYVTAVRPGLEAAGNAPSFVAETALADWLAWEAEVRLLFLNDPPPACGTLQNECVVAHGLATVAIGAHAQRRLDNCTGSALASQLRDVARMADFAGAAAADLTTLNPPLPDATSGALLHACAHLEIAPPNFPAVAALNSANTLRGRVVVDVHTGPDRTDVPLTLAVDGSAVDVAPDGAFTTTLTPTTPGLPLNVTLEAEATDPALQNTAFSASRNLSRPTRARLLLVPQGSTTVPAGGQLGLLVLVAGDGMTDDLTLTVGGPGSVGPTPVTPNGRGEATAVYTAPSSTLNPHAQVIAALVDGTTATVSITVTGVVTVSLDPTSARLNTGGTQDFTATVANSLLGVTWSATGGVIVATGSTTARYDAGSTPGTFSVTATSIADPTRSASATVTVGSSGRVRVVQRRSVATAFGEAFVPSYGGTVSDSDNDIRARPQDAPSPFGSFSVEATVGRPVSASGNSAFFQATASHESTVESSGAQLTATGLGGWDANAEGLIATDFSGNGSAGGTATAGSTFVLRFVVEGGSLGFVLSGGVVSAVGTNGGSVRLDDLTSGSRVRVAGTSGRPGDDISASGTLPPGTYELTAGGSCTGSGFQSVGLPAQNDPCGGAFDFSFRVAP